MRPEPAEWSGGRAGGTTTDPADRITLDESINMAFLALIGLLDPDATAISDGGGVVSAKLHPIEGGEQVARSLLEFAGLALDLTLLERTVNGKPGLVIQQEGVTLAVMAFDVVGEKIKHIWAVRNPEKLRPWTVGHSTSAGCR